MQCSRQCSLLVAVLVVALPSALGASLRASPNNRGQVPVPPVPWKPAPAVDLGPLPDPRAKPSPSVEVPESLVDPSDVSKVALGAESVQALKAESAQAGSTEAIVVDGVTIVEGSAPVAAAPIDMLARATQEVDKQTAELVHSKPAATRPLVSSAVCAQASDEMSAMSCSLVTKISGFAEGCECRMKGTTCPAVRRDLGFTGVSPSVAHSPPELDGESVILCMYWQWGPPEDHREEDAEAQAETTEMARSLVEAAHAHASEAAKVVASGYYAVTPAPVVLPAILPVAPTPAPILQAVPFYGA